MVYIRNTLQFFQRLYFIYSRMFVDKGREVAPGSSMTSAHCSILKSRTEWPFAGFRVHMSYVVLGAVVGYEICPQLTGS